MAKLLIIWPAMERSEEFDLDYLSHHLPLASALPGGSFYTSPTSGSHAHRVTIISYQDEQQLRSSLASDIGYQCREDTERLCAEFGIKPSMHILPE